MQEAGTAPATAEGSQSVPSDGGLFPLVFPCHAMACLAAVPKTSGSGCEETHIFLLNEHRRAMVLLEGWEVILIDDSHVACLPREQMTIPESCGDAFRGRFPHTAQSTEGRFWV